MKPIYTRLTKVLLPILLIACAIEVSAASPKGPAGYKFASQEGKTVKVNSTVHIAFGANKKFTYLYDQKNNVACKSSAFGGDPIKKVKKNCFTKVATKPEKTTTIDYDYILNNGKIPSAAIGHGSRYWDGCKGHCGWSGNTNGNPIKSCDINNKPLANTNAKSSCDGGGSYTCWDMAPRVVSDTLSFGFAAVPGSDSENVCGRCYELSFTGEGKYDKNEIGSGKLKEANKKLVVMATNIGYDVNRSQFDILIPGGGVGAFDAASKQWDINESELGKQYGGFLSSCREQLGWNAHHELVKQCVRNSCDSVFDKPEMADLHGSCHWFVDWYEAADNPVFEYREVSCPQELIDRAY